MRRLIGDQRGASVIEFALMAPVVVTALIGLIEGGRLGLVYFSLMTATQDAAHAAMVGSPTGGAAQTADTIRDLVRANVRGQAADTVAVAVSYSAGNAVNSTVTVTSTTTFTPVLLNLFGTGAFTLSTSTQMPVVN
jgi:Flp pilus assembly protein TadG